MRIHSRRSSRIYLQSQLNYEKENFYGIMTVNGTDAFHSEELHIHGFLSTAVEANPNASQ